MTAQRALVAGGILNLLLAVFHMLFPWIFVWGEDLQAVSAVNRAIIYTFQSVMVFVLLAFAYLSIVHRVDLAATPLGKSVLLMIDESLCTRFNMVSGQGYCMEVVG